MNTIQNDPILTDIQETTSAVLQQPPNDERTVKKMKIDENATSSTPQREISGDSSGPLPEIQQTSHDLETTTTTNSDHQFLTKFSHTNQFDTLEQISTDMEIETPTATPTTPNVEDPSITTEMTLDQGRGIISICI